MPDTSIAHATEHANDKSYQSVDSDTAPAEEHVAEPIQQAEQTSATPQEPVRHQQLMTETPDWALFLDPEKLQQKAGCQPHHLRQLVLREIVDNALDVGAQVTLRQEGDVWVVTDNGPGLDPAMVPELFAVNRPLRSNKARLLPHPCHRTPPSAFLVAWNLVFSAMPDDMRRNTYLMRRNTYLL